jgi:hypothetical protein
VMEQRLMCGYEKKGRNKKKGQEQPRNASDERKVFHITNF